MHNLLDRIARRNRLGHWLLLISQHLASQTAIKFVDFLTALIVIRSLSISQYALLTVANSLLVLGSIGTDLSLSHGVITLGTKIKDSPKELGALFSSAMTLRRKLFALVAVIVIGLAPLCAKNNPWDFGEVAATMLLILILNWIQQRISLNNSILCIHHDSYGLTIPGFLCALFRLILTGAICQKYQTAASILTISMLSTVLNAHLLKINCKKYIDFSERKDSSGYSKVLVSFVAKLLPWNLYYIFQGQLSALFLSFFGYTRALANIGALGRIVQMIGILAGLHIFFIQPHFGRIQSKYVFLKRSLVVIGALLLLCLTTMGISILFPQTWLSILGHQYANLKNELLLAIFLAFLNLIEGAQYFMLIAKNYTKGINCKIVLGITIQLVVLATIGIDNTAEALLINIMTCGGFVLVQMIQIISLFRSWDTCPPKDLPQSAPIALANIKPPILET